MSKQRLLSTSNPKKVPILITCILIFNYSRQLEKANHGITPFTPLRKFLNKRIKDPYRFSAIINSLSYKTGIDIGADSGFFSSNIIAEWKHLEKYYIIRNYTYESEKFDDRLVVDIVNEYTDPATGREKVVLKMGKSSDIAHDFGAGTIDFIYINDKSNILEDLEVYFEKLSERGMICGNNYFRNKKAKVKVRKDVKKFVKNMADEGVKLHIYSTNERLPKISSFYIFKNEQNVMTDILRKLY